MGPLFRILGLPLLILGVSWIILSLSWLVLDHLGSSWADASSSWACLKPFSCHFRANLGSFRSPSWQPFCSSKACLGSSLGLCWLIFHGPRCLNVSRVDGLSQLRCWAVDDTWREGAPRKQTRNYRGSCREPWGSNMSREFLYASKLNYSKLHEELHREPKLEN